MAALSAGAGIIQGRSRNFNRLAYDVANKLDDITTAATADKLVMFDQSDNYTTKYADGDNVLEIMGVTATAAMINRNNDAALRVVSTTLTTLAITLTQHGERIVLVNTNSASGFIGTLAAATGSGAHYKIINNIAQTQGTITVNTTSVFAGRVAALDSTASADASIFKTAATTNTISMNRTTQGGIGYDSVDVWDVASGIYYVEVVTNGSGTLITPFSAV